MTVSRTLIMIVILTNTISFCVYDESVHFHLEVARSLDHSQCVNIITMKCSRCVTSYVGRFVQNRAIDVSLRSF